MKFVMYQDCVSPHQLPIARELVKRLGPENFRYVYRDQEQGDRVKLGWQMAGTESWFVQVGSSPDEAQRLIEDADNLLTMFRLPDLFARRASKGLKTFYQSERWFKPIPFWNSGLCLPGWFKLFHPGYFRMARRMVHLLSAPDQLTRYLPIGPHAARDMRLLCSLHHFFTFHFSFFTPEFIPWGYFVEPSKFGARDVRAEGERHSNLKVLYVGRLLKLKHVDTIIRAVAQVHQVGSRMAAQGGEPAPFVTLTIVGDGPEKTRLDSMIQSCHLYSSVKICPPVPISEVRPLMREHDMLVFASDAQDGWGAVVSEALEEGLRVLGTYETGAAATMLPDACLFHCGDWKELARKLAAEIPRVDIGSWTAASAASRLLGAL